eukprot:2200479-Amphidinium_carterae.1
MSNHSIRQPGLGGGLPDKLQVPRASLLKVLRLPDAAYAAEVSHKGTPVHGKVKTAAPTIENPGGLKRINSWAAEVPWSACPSVSLQDHMDLAIFDKLVASPCSCSRPVLENSQKSFPLFWGSPRLKWLVCPVYGALASEAPCCP